MCGGNVTFDGNDKDIERGIVWSTGKEPVINLSTSTSDGTGKGEFLSSMSDLIPLTQYFVRAYATNSAGTAYGEEATFTTGEIVIDVDNNTR